jgi:hypothetical protein
MRKAPLIRSSLNDWSRRAIDARTTGSTLASCSTFVSCS